jgi:hypothetical protein
MTANLKDVKLLKFVSAHFTLDVSRTAAGTMVLTRATTRRLGPAVALHHWRRCPLPRAVLGGAVHRESTLFARSFHK